MQLVENDAFEIGEEVRRRTIGNEKRQLLGRGEQDIRRIEALAPALMGRCVARADLEA